MTSSFRAATTMSAAAREKLTIIAVAPEISEVLCD
jgi:hypothetical protein